jgi:hypothetical protein
MSRRYRSFYALPPKGASPQMCHEDRRTCWMRHPSTPRLLIKLCKSLYRAVERGGEEHSTRFSPDLASIKPSIHASHHRRKTMTNVIETDGRAIRPSTTGLRVLTSCYPFDLPPNVNPHHLTNPAILASPTRPLFKKRSIPKGQGA